MASHWWLLRRLGLRGPWSSRPARGTTLVALGTSLAASGLFLFATLIAARDAGALAAAAASASLTRVLFSRRSAS